jgi:hypothetical protein
VEHRCGGLRQRADGADEAGKELHSLMISLPSRIL